MTKLQALPFGSIVMRDPYLENALEKEIDYLLSLDVGRFLAGFYENAGIPTPYVRYGGWEDKLIAGHCPGHYLSALAQASCNAGVLADKREKIRGKLVRMVDGLWECQRSSKGKPGFLWAAPPIKRGDPEAQFDNVERGKLNIKTEAWVPWYTMHKLLAGLLDCYRLGGYAPALEVAANLGGWVAARVLAWDEATQKRVLDVEYGGMNDCMYELYALTKEPKYARAAHMFDEEEQPSHFYALRRAAGAHPRAPAGAQAARGPGVDDWPRCTLHPGCRGAAVELLQQRLGRIAEQDAELKGPPVDGCYEETTEQAVRRLQKKFGLREDGAADRETWLLAARLAERR